MPLIFLAAQNPAVEDFVQKREEMLFSTTLIKVFMRILSGVFYLLMNVALWSYFVASCVVIFPFALIIGVIASPFDPNRRVLQKISCLWANHYVDINPFWTIKVFGRENMSPNKTYVMVSNHQSMLDGLVPYRASLHFKWIGKHSTFNLPIVGWMMRLCGHIPVRRGDPESREHCMALCHAWLNRGSSILFFPEGTRSPDSHMLPFKLGAFRLALETGRDILPMVILGGHQAVPKHSLNLTRRSTMTLKILPVISVQDYDRHNPDEVQRLADHVFHQMERALAKV
ncbi:MAG: hypothetical protein A3I75_01485 [Deltaproteobacteria bacterium RIFCSPLOWO2_02_FULL_50_16]|nr:MAG: hypothetical protein A3I75_01485 [Deltaproteobacteria bacterium RIFCSPLOWO2_02_FULL_50_16]